jgi:hypothetical protein
MKAGKYIFIIIACITSLCSCRKETTTSKLSSKSCYVLPSSVNMNGYFVCDGEPGFLASANETIRLGPGHDFNTQAKLSWVGLNITNGRFSQSSLAFDPPLPDSTTRVNTLIQLKPNGSSFVIVSSYTYYDTAFIPHPYTKLYLADRTLSSPKKFALPDSAVIINQVIQMPDGRFAVSSTKGVNKYVSCYNSNLQLDWIQTADYGGGVSQTYSNADLLATSTAIYLLQTNYYIAKYYRTMKYDITGKKISAYDVGGPTNKYAAGQLIESPDGFYVVGTRYLPDKSDYDIRVSNMSQANNLLSAHLWNITDYLPDWNTATRNVRDAFFSGSSSHVIKTGNGYAYTLAYPDSKGQSSLALIMLNNEMKVESIRVIAKNVGNGASASVSEALTISNTGNQMFIMWKQDHNNYFYVLDNEGNLMP